MFDRFRDTCCYCYESVSKGLSICTCDLSLCNKHVEMHGMKFGCAVVCKVTANKNESGEFDVRAEGSENNKEIEEKIAFYLKNEIRGDEEEGAVCNHIKESKLDKVIEKEDEKCEECELKENLWVCLECGHIGCGRQQSGVEGNGHGKDHFHNKKHESNENTAHSHAIYLKSIASESEQIFCYLCDDFIINKYKSGLKRMEKNAELFESSTKTVSEDESAPNEPSNYIGITNNGQSCYISSVLQLMAYALSKFDLAQHYDICCENPLDCFCCQFVKIITGLNCNEETNIIDRSKAEDHVSNSQSDDSMKNNYSPSSSVVHSSSTECSSAKIEITDFLKLLFKEMPQFIKNKQEDCSEFLQALLLRLSFYEESMLLMNITSIFSFTVKTTVACDSCNESTESKLEDKILYVGFEKKLEEAIKNYFNILESSCKCGGKQRIAQHMESWPEKLLVVLKRHKYENETLFKINDPITVSDFTSESVNGADDKRVFGIKGCICHQGNTMDSGHYTWWVNESERYLLISDEKISRSDDKKPEEGVIYLFE